MRHSPKGTNGDDEVEKGGESQRGGGGVGEDDGEMPSVSHSSVSVSRKEQRLSNICSVSNPQCLAR